MPETSLWTFISHADLVVKSVLIILLIASVISWTIIFQRAFMIRKTKRLMRQFVRAFQSGKSLKELKQQLPESHSDLASIFHAGCEEYAKLRAETSLSPELIVENTQRVMRVVEQKRMQRLEHQVPVLATIGSTAPYVGLFGTVWGIMSSFQSLGGVQQATIAMVAPGISEALIATAIGLFAAIPAVVAYNRLVNHLNIIQTDYELFQEELIGLFQRQVREVNYAS